MKVLLITTPYKSKAYRVLNKRIPATLPFLGIAYVAAVLEREGIPVRLLDAWGRNLGFEDIRKEIAAFRPDIIGITCTASAFGVSVELARKIKDCAKDITIVLGGPYVSAIPEETLREIPWVDVVVIGEGEHTMLELAQANPLHAIKGIAYRSGGRILVNEPRPLIYNLDALPFPARNFYRMADYRRPFYEFHGTPFASIVTSRGCPFKCRFCASHTVAGREIRLRSIPNIIKEIDMLLERYKVRFISIADDAPVFTMDEARLSEFCRAIKGKGFLWGAKARADSINENNLRMLRDAGCRILEIGCESGNPGILEGWEKGVSVTQIKNAFRLMNKFGINSVAMFMLGAPAETKETVLGTIRFAKELGATYCIARILYPYPGTEAYADLKAQKMLHSKSWDEIRYPQSGDSILVHPNSTTSELCLPNLTFNQLLRLQRRMHRDFYLNKRYIFSTLSRLKDWHAVKVYGRLLIGVVRFWFRWGLQ